MHDELEAKILGRWKSFCSIALGILYIPVKELEIKLSGLLTSIAAVVLLFLKKAQPIIAFGFALVMMTTVLTTGGYSLVNAILTSLVFDCVFLLLSEIFLHCLKKRSSNKSFQIGLVVSGILILVAYFSYLMLAFTVQDFNRILILETSVKILIICISYFTSALSELVSFGKDFSEESSVLGRRVAAQMANNNAPAKPVTQEKPVNTNDTPVLDEKLLQLKNKMKTLDWQNLTNKEIISILEMPSGGTSMAKVSKVKAYLRAGGN